MVSLQALRFDSQAGYASLSPIGRNPVTHVLGMAGQVTVLYQADYELCSVAHAKRFLSDSPVATWKPTLSSGTDGRVAFAVCRKETLNSGRRTDFPILVCVRRRGG